MANVVIFGASITFGFYDPEGGWVDRLKRHYQSTESPDKDEHTKIYNLGISGNTTSDVLSRLENEIKSRNWESNETIIIFAVGINDSIINDSKNKTPRKEFESNLIKMIKISKKYSTKIAFLGLNPVEESKVTPLPWSPTESYYNKQIKQYDNLIKDACKKENIDFIGLFETFSDREYQKLLSDGLHPNSKGHELIYKIVKEFLAKNEYI